MCAMSSSLGVLGLDSSPASRGWLSRMAMVLSMVTVGVSCKRPFIFGCVEMRNLL